jgi:hypothetical protein
MYEFEGIRNFGRDVLTGRKFKFKIAERNYPAASRRLLLAAIAIMVIAIIYVLLAINGAAACACSSPIRNNSDVLPAACAEWVADRAKQSICATYRFQIKLN